MTDDRLTSVSRPLDYRTAIDEHLAALHAELTAHRDGILAVAMAFTDPDHRYLVRWVDGERLDLGVTRDPGLLARDDLRLWAEQDPPTIWCDLPATAAAASTIEIEIPEVPMDPKYRAVLDAAPCEARRLAGQIVELVDNEGDGNEILLLVFALAAVAIRDGDALDLLALMLGEDTYDVDAVVQSTDRTIPR